MRAAVEHLPTPRTFISNLAFDQQNSFSTPPVYPSDELPPIPRQEKKAAEVRAARRLTHPIAASHLSGRPGRNLIPVHEGVEVDGHRIQDAIFIADFFQEPVGDQLTAIRFDRGGRENMTRA